MKTRLAAQIAMELAAPVSPEVQAFAARLVAGAKRTPLAILFYGSGLRTGDLDGILDFYVIMEQLADWSHGAVAAFANRLLPPNVEYYEASLGPTLLRAKVAILTLDQFQSLCRTESLDNSVWARFSQPVAAVYTRDPAAFDRVCAAVADAVIAAAAWAARLGPPDATPRDLWRSLFRRTYATELRVERPGRADSIVDHAPDRYETLLPPALGAAGIPFGLSPAGSIEILIDERARRRALASWTRRRRLAKPLNLARLAKAAFTFRGGPDYIVWKIARHSGAEGALTEWQHRHPILASGSILWRLWRQRASG